MSRRTRYKPNMKRNSSFGLNITSMTDMFTIMLVFLLQNFSTADVQIDPVNNVRLPSSSSEMAPSQGVQISLSTKDLKFKEEKLATVESNKISKADIDPQDNQFIKPLYDKLVQLSNDGENTKKVLLQADKEMPYSEIRKVFYTASMAGYPDLRLVTIAGN